MGGLLGGGLHTPRPMILWGLGLAWRGLGEDWKGRRRRGETREEGRVGRNGAKG